jgi:UDP-N-acetylmuramoyl-tripeptide--D-alanyl-D-alanine ligase
VTFGLSDACDVRAGYRSTGFGSELSVSMTDAQFTIKLQAAGEHNVRNALAAIACAFAAGIDEDAIVRGLESFTPVGGRLQRKQALSGATVIDDTYNANPDSVRAAIDVLAQAAAPRILVQFDELLAALDQRLGSESDATVLVKGSRFMKMERVVQHLIGQHNTGKDAH